MAHQQDIQGSRANIVKELSIVIPVYKTAHLLKRCLDSLTGQPAYDPGTVELVIVSDHSPDNADDVVSEYRCEHPEIKYITRESNGGPGAARNTGLKSCSGMYYTYLDSDDCVTSDYLSEILRIVRKHTPDMLAYRYETCDETGKTLAVIKARQPGICESEESPASRRLAFRVFALNLRCNAVYRRALVMDLCYREECRLGEDAHFAFEAYLRSKRFYVSNAVIYRYYQYRQSATHNFDEKRLIGLMAIHNIYLDKITREPYYDSVKRDMFYFFASNYLTWLAVEMERFSLKSAVVDAYRSRFESIVVEAKRSRAISSLHASLLIWLTRSRRYRWLRKCMGLEKVLRALDEIKCGLAQ